MNEYVEVNTSELIGVALDWAVAKAVNAECYRTSPYDMEFWLSHYRYAPSSEWMMGGPLIEGYISHIHKDHRKNVKKKKYYAEADSTSIDAYGEGPTYLIAAMRAIVALELGQVVSIPKELAT